MSASLPDFPCWIYFRDGAGVIVRNLEDFHQKACRYDIQSDEWIPREWADSPAKFHMEPTATVHAPEVLPFVEKPPEKTPAEWAETMTPKKRGRPPKS